MILHFVTDCKCKKNLLILRLDDPINKKNTECPTVYYNKLYTVQVKVFQVRIAKNYRVSNCPKR